MAIMGIIHKVINVIKRNTLLLGFVAMMAIIAPPLHGQSSDIWHAGHNTAPSTTCRIPLQCALGTRFQYSTMPELITSLNTGSTSYAVLTTDSAGVPAFLQPGTDIIMDVLGSNATFPYGVSRWVVQGIQTVPVSGTPPTNLQVMQYSSSFTRWQPATLVLNSATFANQGTTSTVYHGNASGNGAFGPVVMGTETSGNYVASFTAGAGLAGDATGAGSTPTLSTASGETDFLANGALTCGAGTRGRAQVHTTPLQYCDASATPTLRYAAYGDSSGNATGSAASLASNGTNCSAGNFPLGVDTLGNAESCTALPTSITGTANQITASSSTGAVTLSIPSNPTLPGTTTATVSGSITTAAGSKTANPIAVGQAGNGLHQPATNTLGLAANGILALQLETVASGVNAVDILPAATGGNPIIRCGGLGSDAACSIELQAKGVASVYLGSNGGHTWQFSGSSGDFFNASGTTGTADMRSITSSATAPVWSFVGDSTTGVGRAGASQLSLIAGATEIVRATAISPTITSNQITNGDTVLLIKRKTDTTPTGNFEDFQNAASTSLWKVDITGNLAAGTVPGGQITGAGTLGDALLTNSYSGIGTCAANTVMTQLGRNAGPACSSLTTSYLPSAVKGWTYTSPSVTLATSTDKVGIGTSSPDVALTVSGNSTAPVASGLTGTTTFHLIGPDTTTARALLDSIAGPNAIDFRRANNTYAAPSALAANDVIGQVTGSGYNGSAYVTGARASIQILASQTWTTGANGTQLDFLITNNGATSTTDVFRIDNNGHVGSPAAIAAPTIACTGTGSSPPAPTIAASSTDREFTAIMNTGTSPATNGTCTVTFGKAYGTYSIPVCFLVDGASAWGNGATIRLSTPSLSAPVFTWNNLVSGTLTALTASSSYKFNCLVSGL